MVARALMFQGTGSDVGKSLMVAGLSRAFVRRGMQVAPFKPQNMSNNAAVTADGGEIGRAQALQALACRRPAVVDMNPVLLKPESEAGAQVVVQGKVWGRLEAGRYVEDRARLLPAVLESFGRLSATADLVLVEGAGSASEVNLRRGDIANMGFARATSTPVMLIGDIERGGVIASLIGTSVVLADEDRQLLRGFLVNKFRGDPRLFDGGLQAIEQATGLPALGVVPYFDRARELPPEDSLDLRDDVGAGRGTRTARDGTASICVPVLSRIANFDDLDPLRAEPRVRLQFVSSGRPLPRDADLVVIPGTKATRADLAFLRAQGWDIDIAAHIRTGGWVLGICGGYQMLGRAVHDPDGIEGPAGTSAGLGWLDVETTLGQEKSVGLVRGVDSRTHTPISGYEIHMGQTRGPDTERPMLDLDGRPDGALSRNGKVLGCYVHGLFHGDAYRETFLRALGAEPDELAVHARTDEALDALADHLERHIDLDRLLALAAPVRLPVSAQAASSTRDARGTGAARQDQA